MPRLKPTEDMYRIALLAMTGKIKGTLEGPNSEMGRKIARTMEDRTEINRLELQRFNNAVLSGNLNHFRSERINYIAWELLKASMLNQRLPDRKLFEELRKFAQIHDRPLHLVLATFRKAYHEIIDETLSFKLR